MKKNPKQIIIITGGLLFVTIVTIICTAKITLNTNIGSSKYETGNSSSQILANSIKYGITLGGIEGTYKGIDTSDATATANDIDEGYTAYVNGIKITGTNK